MPDVGAKRGLDVCDLPGIVTFMNSANPSDARPVLFDENKFAEFCNILFKSAEIEIVSNAEGVTDTDVRRFLPWVPQTRPEQITGTAYQPSTRFDDYPDFYVMDTAFSIRQF